MIKVKDLRLNNLIIVNKGGYCNDNTIQKVTSISEKGINSWSDMGSSGFVKEENITPIPLTEEWLLRFGFVSNPYQDRYELGKTHIQCDKTKVTTDLWIEGAPHIKYVHSLQNYVFALTGQELELK